MKKVSTITFIRCWAKANSSSSSSPSASVSANLWATYLILCMIWMLLMSLMLWLSHNGWFWCQFLDDFDAMDEFDANRWMILMPPDLSQDVVGQLWLEQLVPCHAAWTRISISFHTIKKDLEKGKNWEKKNKSRKKSNSSLATWPAQWYQFSFHTFGKIKEKEELYKLEKKSRKREQFVPPLS